MLGSFVAWCFRSWLGTFVLAIPLFAALYLHTPNGPEPLASLSLDWKTFVYYAIPFFAGWWVYPKRESINVLSKKCWIPLTIGAGIAFPLYLSAMGAISRVDTASGEQPSDLLIAGANASRALVTSGISLGLIGLFTRVLSAPGERLGRIVRYGSDSAYWVYLVHMPIVVMVSIFMLKSELSPELKMLVNMIVSSIVIFASYHLCVRYTPIGTLLNGKRQRVKRTKKSQPE